MQDATATTYPTGVVFRAISPSFITIPSATCPEIMVLPLLTIDDVPEFLDVFCFRLDICNRSDEVERLAFPLPKIRSCHGPCTLIQINFVGLLHVQKLSDFTTIPCLAIIDFF